MGSSLSTPKLRCLYLPAQSGKTRKSEELITQVKLSEGDHEESIDIWISANNKLLVYQTTSRLTNDLGLSTDFSDAIIKGKLFSWTSGRAATNLPHTELAKRIRSGEVEAILVCAHPLRLAYLADLIRRLERKRFRKSINIWIDEADRSVSMWMKQAEVADCPLVKNITLVSATFSQVFKRFSEVRVLPYIDTHPTVYRRMKDCEMIVEDFNVDDEPSYVALVLDKHPEIARPGTRSFIPGGVWRSTHEEISSLLLAQGFAVLILNGKSKEIRLPPCIESDEEVEVIPLKPYLTVKDPEDVPEEFNLTLSKLYIEHELDRFPLAVTGFLCVERGVTFQLAPAKDGSHNGFLFDYAICSPVENKSEAYQSMARVFGNLGSFPGYKPCVIYSTTKNFARVQDQEETAVHIARIVHDEKLKTVNVYDLKRASRYYDERMWVLTMIEYKTFEEARDYIKDRTGRSPNIPHLEKDGFYHSSTSGRKCLLDHREVIREMGRWSKTSSFDTRLYPDRTFHSRLYICYKDTEDPSSAVFLVRSIQKRVGLRRKVTA